MRLFFAAALACGVLAWAQGSDLIVDIAPLFESPSTAEHERSVARVIEQLEAAFRTHGTVLLKGHGIPKEDRDSYFGAVGDLLSLDAQDKLSVKVDPRKAIGRGYLPFGAESGLLSDFLEPKEGFSFGDPRNTEARTKMSSPNVWPAALRPASREAFGKLFLQLTDVAAAITDTLVSYRNAQSRDVPSKRTDIVSDRGAEISLLRVFHYFSKTSPQFQASPAASGQQSIGSSPHTDWGLFTFIVPNHITGLQYVHNNSWIDVPYVEDTIAMNVGDFFSLATKGEYHSPIHRVLVPEDENRVSFVLFYYPNYDSLISFPKEEEIEEHQQCRADEEAACVGEAANALAFNTLLSKHKLQGKEVQFGDYIVEKWEGVTRTGY